VDVFGNEVLEFNSYIENDKIISLDISSLGNEMYFLKIAEANGMKTVKFIKK